MAKLKVYVNGQLDGAENICDAVFKTLSQRVNLYAELDMVSPEEIRQINSDNRHIDAVTDVLN